MTGVPHLPPGSPSSAYRCVPDFLQYPYAPDVSGRWCVGTLGDVGVPESRNANKLGDLAVERRVLVGSPNARLSRFVATSVRAARDYDSDITVGYEGREADVKSVQESMTVLGKVRRGKGFS